MATETKERKKIRVVTYNNKQFVVGLEWRSITGGRNFMKEVKRIGKEEKLDVVAIRQTESVQAGFAPQTDIPLKGKYSFSISLVSLLPGRWIGVFPVAPDDASNNEYIIIATSDGIIFPATDKIIMEDEVEQEVNDLKSRLSLGEGKVEIYGDAKKFFWVTSEISLSEILAAKNLKKEYKLKLLTWGLTKKQIYFFIALFIAALFALYLVNVYLEAKAEEERLERVEARKKAEKINEEARYKASLDSLKHPWVTQASIQNFIKTCDSKLPEIPLSLAGRKPVTLDCSHNSIDVLYERLDGSSVGSTEFKEKVEQLFNTTPSFNMKQPSIVGFSLALDNKPDGDDPVASMSEQLNKFVTLLQRNNIEFTLTDAPSPEKKVDGQGVELPLPDWREIYFSYDSMYPPRDIFKQNNLSGMRVTNIIYVINNDTSEILYKVKGVIYYGKK